MACTRFVSRFWCEVGMGKRSLPVVEDAPPEPHADTIERAYLDMSMEEWMRIGDDRQRAIVGYSPRRKGCNGA